MKRYHIRGVPTIIFIDRDGQEENDLRIESYVDNTELLNRMTSLLHIKYINKTSWNFQSTSIG